MPYFHEYRFLVVVVLFFEPFDDVVHSFVVVTTASVVIKQVICRCTDQIKTPQIISFYPHLDLHRFA